MDELKRTPGKLIVKATRRIAQRWIARDLPLVKAARGEERLKRASSILAKHGFMPELRCSNGRYTLKQHHCLLKRVGAEHPEVCEMVSRWIQGPKRALSHSLKSEFSSAWIELPDWKNSAAPEPYIAV